MEARCKFTDSNCKYSHGETVNISELKEFIAPDFSKIKVGASVLAKSSQKLIWEHAVIDMIAGDQVLIKWNEANSESLPMEALFPLDDDEQEDEYVQADNSYSNDQENAVIYIQPEAEQLGSWEKHTKGVASKIMAKMGYMFGSGLGKRSEGRVEPVPVKVYPMGRSLDWCLDHGQAQSMTEVNEKAAKKILEKNERLAKKAEKDQVMFKFLDMACSSRSSQNLRKSESSSHIKTSDSLNVQSLKTEQNARALRDQLKRLEESARRHSGSNTEVSRTFQVKIEAIKAQLSKLESRSGDIQKDREREKERKKMTTF